ncbi:UDP pyrophosphate phosphatase [Paenibacillus swuensis]|uniref:Undecaprenyl-diphosphatase n=1 Tax=Paenibacillus swuensis TaxID=1178515 RepID=A0A172TGK1_9BACL|nr:undecaprenyl-diphosphate phosphatase [Paenibacillus swuensis]ANE46066.1 UDP pyrophosphate phosphatase [Paenibacillus swuensis]
MNIWELIVAFLLGLVEGLTEFAPVSSTGHMIIVDDMLLHSKELFSEPVANTFKVVIQLGSILAVLLVFKDRFMNLLGLSRKVPVEAAPPEQAEPGTIPSASSLTPNHRLKLTHVLVGLIPAGVLGFLFEDYIDEYLFSVRTVIFGLIIGALLMIAADKLRPKTTTDTVDGMTYKQALGMGLFQCVGLWPGFSRSGSTISGGVLLGMGHRAASDFTFIMAVPVMLGASTLSMIKNWEYFTVDALPFFIVGFISAFIFALISIRFFLKLINRIKLIPFAIYRIILAILIYALYL